MVVVMVAAVVVVVVMVSAVVVVCRGRGRGQAGGAARRGGRVNQLDKLIAHAKFKAAMAKRQQREQDWRHWREANVC